MSNPLTDDYRAIREGAAIGAVDRRRAVAVAGKDRAAYLQGLLTNDLLALTPGTGCYAAWLTPQGRMLTDMHVLESGDMMLLDVPADRADATLQRLDQFLFTEEVQLSNVSDVLAAVWVHGPAAGSMLETILSADGLSSWPEYRNARAPFGGASVAVARISQLGVPGFCVHVEKEREEDLRGALVRAGAVEAGGEAIGAARIEAGYPVFGADMTEETIPLEAGIEDRAISFTKGCYVGQEVIIRVLHRGHGRVAKKLVALQLEEDSAAPGARIYSADRDIGSVTSAARSPRRGAIALGYVHRDFLVAGTRVEVEGGGRRLPAIVSSRPM